MAIAMRYGTPGESSGGAGGSSGGGVTISKLWTNPSPTSNFAAQTVSLDLSSYDAVIVVVAHSITGSEKNPCWLMKGDYNGNAFTAYHTGSYIYARPANVSDTGIVFGQGARGGTTNNQYAIPVEIYGVKF